jgi:hypothetical protein
MNVGQTTSVKGNYPGNMSNKLTARRFALEVKQCAVQRTSVF